MRPGSSMVSTCQIRAPGGENGAQSQNGSGFVKVSGRAIVSGREIIHDWLHRK